MIKQAIFRCKISEINCASLTELRALLERIGQAIQLVHPSAQIDPQIEVAQVEGHVIPYDGEVNSFMAVKRAKSGETEYYKTEKNETVPISQEEYLKAHRGVN